MSKRDADILYFVAFCLEGYKNKHGLTGVAASELFDRHGIKQFLSDHYDILHTQGMPWILEEIEEKIGFVNVYEFDEKAAEGLKRLDFSNPPGDEWVDFVHANRTRRDFTHDYDLVYGPVANDRVYAAFALYEQGLLDKQELIAELKTYKLIDQMLFHTEESLKCLRFIEAKEVRP